MLNDEGKHIFLSRAVGSLLLVYRAILGCQDPRGNTAREA